MLTIRTERLVKKFDAFQLGPLDLRLANGEVLGVMGPNGAGKTTLLRLLWGFMPPDSGRISILGTTPHLDQIQLRTSAGYLSENQQFYSDLTAKQFLRFVGRFYDRWDEARISSLLEQFEVRGDMKIGNLSKGTRVKLGLISAVGHRPKLLLLDEPTSGLDPVVRLEILHLLRKLAIEEGVAIVLSSHISDDLDRIAGTVLMVNGGRVVEYEPAARLIERYGQPRLEDIFVTAIGNKHRS